MRILLFVVILVHGLIHLMGFAKAFEFAELGQLRESISRPIGLLWLACSLAFFAAGGLYLSRATSWWWIALPAVALSQTLIIMTWGDAKFGTVANLIVVAVAIAAAVNPRLYQ